MRQTTSRLWMGVDVAVVGVPFDSGAVSFRSGSRLGPRKIREASLLLWGYNEALRVAPLDVLHMADYGDVIVEPANLDTTMRNIVAEVGSILEAGPTVIALGGDHSISLPLLRAHAARFGPLAVIHLDAHPDTWEGQVDHSTPFRHAIQEGLIDTKAYMQIGVRGPVWDATDIPSAKDLGAQVLTTQTCMEAGIPAIVQMVRDRVGARRTYVSLDIDVADPAYAPGVGTPEVGGLTSYQLLQLVRGMQGLNLVGFDLVEVCPPYDCSEITAILAANLVFEFLSLLALRRRAGGS
ncbi:MAG: agmatinase [Chloroflexi bacterium RBG_13_56_8]|nr:MAG: agmatinase [Chloroflexi bacterium RBG_13_56_8]